MGVPAFFRWLTKKYPSIVVECIDERPLDANFQNSPVDSSQPNPNDVEFDNLYLDMNGIIHPCTHPENKPAPKNEDEMMVAIFECIDHMFSIVRPRKLLYMAIDGVAPRAKMNQQRSRRFRASKETSEKINEIARIKAVMTERGYTLPPESERGEHFDSNCITPGTPFMARLSRCLNYYIHNRLNNDPGWKGIQVILSDANVPGEGEHKIMDFIRRQRAQPNHDPNTHHCLCGADADLIMLGLATHEPNFTIIREEFQYNQQKRCEICGQTGHEMKECQGLQNTCEDSMKKIEGPQKYIFVRLNVLREYLSRELEMPGLPFEYNFERALDDWVFMCFFVGNDFLPHLPSLEIREGAIDKLVALYKKTVRGTGGFITDSGNVFMERVQLIMDDLGQLEDGIFKKRRRNDLMFRQRCIERKRGDQAFKIEEEMRKGNFQRVQELKEEKIEEDEIPDDVKLWEPGYKDRYYRDKFLFNTDNIAKRYEVAREYVKGLCWVLKYYYQGCVSWKWFYPYHYAPFASDFCNIADKPVKFEKFTKPFSPLEQLMGVFPAASSAHVPAPFAELMTNKDSPIQDFYPDDFDIDLNGKKFAWQGVALLPFVEEERLKKALKPVLHLLTDDERERNTLGDNKLYVAKDNNCYDLVLTLSDGTEWNGNPLLNNGLLGTVHVNKDYYFQGNSVQSPVRGLSVVNNNNVLCLIFQDPVYEDGFEFKARRLEGAIDPPTVLKPEDFKSDQHYRPRIGMGQRTDVASLSDSGYRMLRHFAEPVGPSDRNKNTGYQQMGYNRHVRARTMVVTVPNSYYRPPAPDHHSVRDNNSGFNRYHGMDTSNNHNQPNRNSPNSKLFYDQMRNLRLGNNLPYHNGGGPGSFNRSRKY